MLDSSGYIYVSETLDFDSTGQSFMGFWRGYVSRTMTPVRCQTLQENRIKCHFPNKMLSSVAQVVIDDSILSQARMWSSSWFIFLNCHLPSSLLLWDEIQRLRLLRFFFYPKCVCLNHTCAPWNYLSTHSKVSWPLFRFQL